MRTFEVIAIWDDEAEVWSVDKCEIPGVAAWGATPNELIKKLKIIIPEMLELNGHLMSDDLSDGVDIKVITNNSTNFEAACGA